jgi:hypothetical protein
MTTTEDRLRAAVRAAAETVTPGSAPPLRLPGRRLNVPGRGHRGRWLQATTPLAAAVSVIAVLTASLAIANGLHGRQAGTGPAAAPAAALASVPPYYAALAGPPDGLRHAVVRATATGAVLATVTPPKPYRTFTFVTGAADDRTFVLAAQRWWAIGRGTAGLPAEELDGTAATKFFRLLINPATRSARLTALPLPEKPQAEQVAGIGLSPDGSKLALALRDVTGPGNAPRGPGIQVITLATGAARDWVWPGAGWIGNFKPLGEPLSWTADARVLAFQEWTGNNAEVRLLDTTAPGSNLRSSKLVVKFPNAYAVTTLDPGNTIITPDATKIAAPTMVQAQRQPYRTELQITEFSASTGKVVRVLDPWRFQGPSQSWQNVLWASSAGSTLIVATPPGMNPPGRWNAHGIEPVVGVLTGQQFTPLPNAPQDTGNIAW